MKIYLKCPYNNHILVQYSFNILLLITPQENILYCWTWYPHMAFL
jgi:hypothetical protein